MTGTMYVVCRTAKVALGFIALANMPEHIVRSNLWDAPILDENARVFSSKADAASYCDKMNSELKTPQVDKDGRMHINVLPYDDYAVIPVGKGAKR